MSNRTAPALFFPLLAALLSAGAVSAQAPSTRDVTDRYLELTFSQRYDDLLDVYAPDAVFHDPTGDVFNGPVAQGPIVGAERIVAVQKGWGLAETEFDIDTSFTVGEYSLYRGTLNTRYSGSSAWTAFPFLTVLRVVDGRVLERTDFGEYVTAFGLAPRFADATRATKDVADRYLRAYLDGDVDAQVALASADVMFQDPTSQVYGPPSGELYEGVAVLEERRRQVFENVQDFDLQVTESFAQNHHAVYMGTTSYTLSSGHRFAQPAVFVIEVREGAVTRQWDFVDYSVGPLEP